jgi:hypothetical protein
MYYTPDTTGPRSTTKKVYIDVDPFDVQPLMVADPILPPKED